MVGLADAVATTTRDHQVKIQFAWQRGRGANAGGMDHNTDDQGNAPRDDGSGTWVRVDALVCRPAAAMDHTGRPALGGGAHGSLRSEALSWQGKAMVSQV